MLLHFTSIMPSRPETVVPEWPQPPFPLRVLSQVVCGFGRGSAELGIPTANIPIVPELNLLETGIYYGWSRIVPRTDLSPAEELRHDGKSVQFTYGSGLCESTDLQCLPMVMSIGWNPFYNNKTKTAEVHIIHKFATPFYGAGLKLLVLGYIRPELDYTSKGM